jgi:hypothetical protein
VCLLESSVFCECYPWSGVDCGVLCGTASVDPTSY